MSEQQLVWIGMELNGGRVVTLLKDAVGIEKEDGISYHTFAEVEKMLGV